ncbi:MAG: oligosaccharide flippase family protein [Patescibacteria group bacterium]|nr:oligosaccharide flippase family protein [Patescibacteria group bacterium]
MGYFPHTVRSLSWTGALRVTIRVITFFRIVLLARFLTPGQFGVFGIASIVYSFLDTFSDIGLTIFFIQTTEPINIYLSTVWILSILRGVFMTICILVFAPVVISFFHNNNVYGILLFISLVPFIRGFINPSVLLFQKDLIFEKEYLYRSFLYFIDSLVVISVAFLTRSAVSLVAGMVISAVFETLLSFFIVKPLPKFSTNIKKIKHILHAGKWITFSGIATYFFQNGDDIVVGKLLSSSSLGLYQMAYKLALLPNTEISNNAATVTFPVYTKIAHDLQRLKRAVLKTTGLVSLFSIIIAVILYIFPNQIIGIILGKQWEAAAPVLQILVIYGALRSISGSIIPAFLALKMQKTVAVINFVSLATLMIGVIPCILFYGLRGAGYAVLFSSITAFITISFFTKKIFF